MTDNSRYPGAPRWVKVTAIIATALAVAVLLIVLSGIGGPHGPGRHTSSNITEPKP